MQTKAISLQICYKPKHLPMLCIFFYQNRTIFHHQGTTQALAFTPDSQYLVSACSLEYILIWDRQDLINTITETQCLPSAEADNAIDLGILSLDISNVITADGMQKIYTQYYNMTRFYFRRWNVDKAIYFGI